MRNIILFAVCFLYGSFLFAQDTLKFNADYLPAENKVLVFKPQTMKKIPLPFFHIQAIDSIYWSKFFSSIREILNPSKKYPLMFLLHGWSGCYSDWSEHVNLQKYADDNGIIIVCPDGYYDSWYVDSPIKKNNQMQKFFWSDLVPELKHKYGGNINFSKIFITGLSMGGHGALITYMSNESFFCAAGSMSGILDIREFSKKWGISKVLGKLEKKNISVWDRNSVIENLTKITRKNRAIIIDCGTEDFAYDVNVAARKRAESLGIKIIFNSRKGVHDWKFWKVSLGNHIKYFKSLCN